MPARRLSTCRTPPSPSQNSTHLVSMDMGRRRGSAWYAAASSLFTHPLRPPTMLSWRVMWAGEGRELAKPLVLYSTNTWLAYTIAEKYYNGMHYVWCTPYFDPRRHGNASGVPPTSSPLEVYESLRQEVLRGERHSPKMKENRAGLRRGASAKRRTGIIDEAKEKEIITVIKLANGADFRPLMYVIPYSKVGRKLREPPPEDKAHPLSAEYLIDELSRNQFDVIEFGG